MVTEPTPGGQIHDSIGEVRLSRLEIELAFALNTAMNILVAIASPTPKTINFLKQDN